MRLAASQPVLRQLEWRVRHAADAAISGDYRTALRGRGREFDQVVRYEWGDDVRDIDWNVTARLGEPYRKKFVEERELTVALLVEDAPSLAFGSGRRTKRDVLLEIAGLFALLAAANRDRVGLWHAQPGETHVQRAERGRAQIVRRASELLATPVPEPAPGERMQDIDWVRFSHVFPRHAVVIWLADFPPRDPPPHWRAMRRRFEVIGVRVDDPWERELPESGLLSVVDPVDGELVPFDPRSRATRRRHAEWGAARDRAFDELFPSKLQQLVVTTEEDPLDALVRFFRARMRVLGA
jgi:uncharacterized protein (DUF58 family)